MKILQIPSWLRQEISSHSSNISKYIPASETFFLFQANLIGGYAAVGQDDLGNAVSILSFTRISILDVWRLYGLQSAYSFLHYVYHSNRSMYIYLAACSALIDSAWTLKIFNRRDSMAVLSVTYCSYIMSHLQYLETTLPTVTQQEEATRDLPTDILCIILQGRRDISKELTARLLQKSRSAPISENEREAFRRMPYCIRSDRIVACVRRHGGYQIEEIADTVFKLERSKTTIGILCQQLSPEDLVTLYNARGCNGEEVVSELVQNLDVASLATYELMSWTLLLQSHCIEGTYTREQLQELLSNDLIESKLFHS